MSFPEVFRLLRASPLPAAAAMLQTLEIILKNAVEKGGGPEGEKYTSLRASNAALRSKVLEVSGGVLTLLLAGFQKVTEAGNVMYKLLPGYSAADLVEALEWIRAMEGTLPSLPPAPCLLQIKLATGSVSIVGAFERNDTLQDVYNFLSTVSTYVKSDFVLCGGHPVIEYTDEWLSKTVEAAGLCPRSVLLLKRAPRAECGPFAEPPRLSTDPVFEPDKARLEEMKRLKAALADKRRADEEAKQKAILAFKSDRLDVGERTDRLRVAMTDRVNVKTGSAVGDLGAVSLFDVPIVPVEEPSGAAAASDAQSSVK